VDPQPLDFKVLAPIVFVAVGALLALLGELLLTRGEGGGRRPVGHLLAAVASGSLLVALYAAGSAFADGTNSVFNPANPMLRLDAYSSFATGIIGLGALLSVSLSVVYLKALHIDYGEYYALLLLSTTGMFALVSAVDLLVVFLGIELMSIPIYALAGFDRRNLRSNEAGIKYFLVGGFASAILLYGIALLYGVTGSTEFAGIRAGFDSQNSLALAGLVLVLVGFAFKVASVPFHQWAPDVYEGAPTSVTAFMSVTVKAAAFAALLRFLMEAIPASADLLHGVLWVLAVASMIVGNVMAVIQTNVKRMLGYSGVAHAGYVLIGFVAGTPEGYAAVLLYLLFYVFINLGVFAVVVSLAQGGQECERIDDFSGLAARRPALAAALTLFMVALAGIPGTAGFIGKFQLFNAAVSAELIPLVIVGVLTSLVSLFYYLRLPVVMYMRDASEDESDLEVGTSEQIVLLVCAGAVLWLGILPESRWFPALEMTRSAAGALFP
jgi:NADH-quinone oxidoreductase subunit N